MFHSLNYKAKSSPEYETYKQLRPERKMYDNHFMAFLVLCAFSWAVSMVQSNLKIIDLHDHEYAPVSLPISFNHFFSFCQFIELPLYFFRLLSFLFCPLPPGLSIGPQRKISFLFLAINCIHFSLSFFFKCDFF